MIPASSGRVSDDSPKPSGLGLVTSSGDAASASSTSSLAAPSTLPIHYRPIRGPEDIPQLKILHDGTFPLVYETHFYQWCMSKHCFSVLAVVDEPFSGGPRSLGLLGGVPNATLAAQMQKERSSLLNSTSQSGPIAAGGGTTSRSNLPPPLNLADATTPVTMGPNATTNPNPIQSSQTIVGFIIGRIRLVQKHAVRHLHQLPISSSYSDQFGAAAGSSSSSGSGSSQNDGSIGFGPRIPVAYIATFGVLPEYRSRGVGRELLDRLLGQFEAKGAQVSLPSTAFTGGSTSPAPSGHLSLTEQLLKKLRLSKLSGATGGGAGGGGAEQAQSGPAERVFRPLCEEVYLHCLETNVQALEFYRKRGFQVVDRLPDYYSFQGAKHSSVILRAPLHLATRKKVDDRVPVAGGGGVAISTVNGNGGQGTSPVGGASSSTPTLVQVGTSPYSTTTDSTQTTILTVPSGMVLLVRSAGAFLEDSEELEEDFDSWLHTDSVLYLKFGFLLFAVVLLAAGFVMKRF
jgi:ribosomal protein S18 acetylase RimI-like enzyme